MITKNEIREQLLVQEHTVTFTKADGTERKMRCTLKEEILPVKEDAPVDSKKKRKIAEEGDHLSVWDLDKAGWRSFNVSKVIKIT